MDLYFDRNISDRYNSTIQKVRVMSEDWTERNIFCPNCGGIICKLANNYRAADFYCNDCREFFELKSKRKSFGNLITDGAYSVMLEKIYNNRAPNLFLLNYNIPEYKVINFFVVPKHYFTSDILVKRKPLSLKAKRANWVGCNILIGEIPLSGRIYYLNNHKLRSREEVMENWEKTLFLRKEYRLRGWTLDIMRCIDQIDKEEFDLHDVYKFTEHFKSKYPGNKHIRDKIRQQLQYLRDKGYLIFLSRGKYKKKL